MKRTLLLSVMLASLSTLGCRTGPASGTGSASAALGEACQVSADCGPGLECQIENDVGTCKAHKGADEQGGGKDDKSGGKDDKGGGTDDAGNADDHGSADGGVDDKGQGLDDPNNADGGHGADDPNKMDDKGVDPNKMDDKGQGVDDGGVVPPQVSCASNSDCAVGEECEIEHGVGVCKQHGGK